MLSINHPVVLFLAFLRHPIRIQEDQKEEEESEVKTEKTEDKIYRRKELKELVSLICFRLVSELLFLHSRH